MTAKLIALLVLLFVNLQAVAADAATSNQTEMQESLATIFAKAVAPAIIQKNLTAREYAYTTKNFGVGPGGDYHFDSAQLNRDKAFCTEQSDKAYWVGYVPFYGKQFRHQGHWRYLKNENAAHAKHPRCKKYQVEFYKNHPQFLKENASDMSDGEHKVLKSGFIYERLPWAFLSEIQKIYQERSLALVKSELSLVGAEMAKIAKNPSAPQMLVCAAVAISDVARNAVSVEKHMSGIDERFDESEQEIYSRRLKFLAFTISDWIAKTGGNSSLCPNFGLELKVDELTSRVDAAEQRLIELENEVTELRVEVNQLKGDQSKNFIFTMLGFWYVGYAGHTLISPL